MRALIVGYYGYGNAGDEALLTSLLQGLPPQIAPVVLSRDPRQTAQRYQRFGVLACSRRDGLNLWQQVQNAQALIWGGGGLIQDVTSWRSPLYYLGLMGLAQKQGSHTLAWAQGIGPLQRRWIQSFARRSFQGCSGVSVRDRGSAALLQSWGIPHLEAPDPVWALDPISQDLGIPDRPCMAIVLRQHRDLTPAKIEVLKTALGILQRETGWHGLLLPFQLGSQASPSADEILAEQVAGSLESAQVLKIGDPQVLRGVFERVSWALVMRFHGLVMAAAAGCGCFGLSYDPKVSYLLEALSFPGWTLAQMPTDPVHMAQTWLEHYEMGSPLNPAQRQDWRQRALVHHELLAQVLLPDN